MNREYGEVILSAFMADASKFSQFRAGVVLQNLVVEPFQVAIPPRPELFCHQGQ
jgi:hypothetical protein